MMLGAAIAQKAAPQLPYLVQHNGFGGLGNALVVDTSNNHIDCLLEREPFWDTVMGIPRVDTTTTQQPTENLPEPTTGNEQGAK